MAVNVDAGKLQGLGGGHVVCVMIHFPDKVANSFIRKDNELFLFVLVYTYQSKHAPHSRPTFDQIP